MNTNPIRLSSIEQLVLKLMLTSSSEFYGYDLMQQSGGRLKTGTIYVTLGRMEEKGYIESRKEQRQPGARGLPKRLYKITGHGMRVFQEWESPSSFTNMVGV